jgi:hypothetical protein
MNRFRKSALYGTLGLTATIGAVLANDEGSRRSARFWINIFPIYLQYRGIQFLHSDLKLINDSYSMELYNRTHNRYAIFVRDLTYEMRGFYLKQVFNE